MSTVRSPKSRGEAAYCRFADNPFFILDVRLNASLAQIHRAAMRLLEALERGEAQTYATPLGPRPRTATAVRHAVTRLRDRDERVQHEIWAAADPATVPVALGGADTGWTSAQTAFGWRGR